MSNTKDKFNLIINGLKNNIGGPNYCLVILKYDTKEFYQKNVSVSELFKTLVNSIRNHMGVYNRDWYKQIKNGFYKSEETNEVITIYLGLIPFNDLDLNDLEGRITNLGPFPISLEIGFNDRDMLNGVFSNLTNMITSISVFGTSRNNSKKVRSNDE